MSAPPQWIDGKLLCQHPDCGREMYLRWGYALCAIYDHGGLFPIPDKPPCERKQKPQIAELWKGRLPLARRRFRKYVSDATGRTSVAVWRVAGDPEHAWTPARFDWRPGDDVPDGCIVARFHTTWTAFRTVVLKPFPIIDADRKYRQWERE
jgi:hypothetical protein